MTTDSQSLSAELFGQLQGAPLQQISRQLGTAPDQTASAVGAALPLLLGALGRNAAQPQGAQALFGALQRDHGGLDLGSVLGAVLGGGGGAAAGGAGQGAGALNGAAILGHIFGGGQQQRAQDGLSQATGLSGAGAASLLQLLAPIVMNFLAQRAGQGGLDAGGLGQTLGQERLRAEQQGGAAGGLLGAVLDQDGDGRVDLGDLIKLGTGLLGGRR